MANISHDLGTEDNDLEVLQTLSIPSHSTCDSYSHQVNSCERGNWFDGYHLDTIVPYRDPAPYLSADFGGYSHPIPLNCGGTESIDHPAWQFQPWHTDMASEFTDDPPSVCPQY
jgi:hypothetical protein